MANYSIENHTRIYNDDTGEFYTVRPDADGLDMVQIDWTDPRTNIASNQFVMPVSVARLVAAAILEKFPATTP